METCWFTLKLMDGEASPLQGFNEANTGWEVTRRVTVELVTQDAIQSLRRVAQGITGSYTNPSDKIVPKNGIQALVSHRSYLQEP